MRLFLALLLLSGCLISGNGFANDALSEVLIVEGINQQRPPNNRSTIGKRYVWNFQGKSYTVLMIIDVEKYNSYAGKERYDIPKLVAEGTGVIGNLTREFQKTFRQNRDWTQQERVDFVLSFVQSLPYTHDDVTTGYDEFRRYAIETLIEGGGDCEDTTILAAAILSGLGESTALIFTPGHIALGVSGDFKGTAVAYKDTNYYYCETTGTGWTVGTVPAAYARKIESIVPLTPFKTGPAPEPQKVTRPSPVQPTPTPKPTTPTVAPTPEKPKPVRATASDTDNVAGHIIAIVFILVGIAVPIVYLVYRYLLSNPNDDGDDDWPDEDTDDDDSLLLPRDTDSRNPLDE